jgi:hypothetical protein
MASFQARPNLTFQELFELFQVSTALLYPVTDRGEGGKFRQLFRREGEQ